MGAKSLRSFLLAAAIIAPLVLLAIPQAAFYGDWDLNLWLIGYQGEFLHEHGRLPAALGIQSAVGLPVPVFYGVLLYPILGFFSSLLGPAWGLRLGALLLISLETYALLSAGRNVFRDRKLAFTTAVAVIWSVYSLTNLYNRSAVAEFFAAGFLVSSIAFAVAAAADLRLAERGRYAWLAGFAAVLALGSHPPTALLAAPCLAILALVLLAGWKRTGQPAGGRMLVSVLTPLVLGAALLAPWVYANLRWSSLLGIVASYKGLSFFPDRCDSWLGRFCPIPYDGLSLRQGTAGLSTPYLEAPVITALLVLLAWNLALLIRLRREPPRPASSVWEAAAAPALFLSLAGFAFFIVISLSPVLAGHVRFLGPYVQFAYRLVAFANAALLVAVFASGAMAARHNGFVRWRRLTGILALAAFILATIGLGIKMDHAGKVRWQNVAPEFTARGSKFPLVTEEFGRFSRDYSTPSRYRELSREELATAIRLGLPVYGNPPKFGTVPTVTITSSGPRWAVTNVVAFPWNDLLVDGHPVAADNLGRMGDFIAVRLHAGVARLQWVWHPDPLWTALRWLSLIAAIILFAGTVVKTVRG